MSLQKKTSTQQKQQKKPVLVEQQQTCNETGMAIEVHLPYFAPNTSQKGIFYNYVSNNPVFSKMYQLCMKSMLEGNHKQSVFFAEKLVCLNNDSQALPYTVYLLAMCYLNNGENTAVYNLVTRNKLMTGEFCILVGRAMLANKQFELALEVLSEDSTSQGEWIKAQCYEALENKSLAIQSYYHCIQKDAFAVGAFNRLVDSFLVNQIEKEQLIHSIQIEEQWMREFYMNKIDMNQGHQYSQTAENLNEEKKKVIGLLQLSQSDAQMKNESILIKPSPLKSNFQNIYNKDECMVSANKSPQTYQLITSENVYKILEQKNNIDILCMKSKAAYYNYDIQTSYDWAVKAIKQDPLYFDVIPVYAACLVELNQLAELYYCAHNLIENYTQHALSWFVIGAYYFLTKKYDTARKQFQKAIQLDQHMIYAWIGLAHSYAVQDESDQAMSIYRSIARQFPGCYQAHIYIGMEYLRTNNLKTAILSLHQAKDINLTDPMIYNELGVIYFKQRQYIEAKEFFLTTLAYCQNSNHRILETALQNLAHTYRKLKDFKNAIRIFERCVQLNSTSHQIYFGLAFTYHLSEQLQTLSKAIHFYHKSLSLKHDQPFVQEMLGKALTEAADAGFSELIIN